MDLAAYRLKNPEAVVSPALIYYRDILEKNARALIAVAGGSERLWPHVKSHKCADMVRMLMDMGIARFKCATIAEGEMVGAAGASHAIIAYPLVGPNIPRMVRLAQTFSATEYFAVGDDAGQL